MKKIYTSIILILFSVSAFSQNISTLFEIMPDEQLIQIDTNRRKDMYDLKKNGKDSKMLNKLGGYSEITNLTDDYLKLQVSQNSTFEMRILDSIQGGKILAVIKTVCAPSCDSEISFYNSVWQRIPQNEIFVKPSVKDFLLESTLADDSLTNEIIKVADINFLNMSFVDGKPEISVTIPFEELLPEEEIKFIKPYIKETPLFLEWKEGRFVKKND
ncbi:MAG: DUF3256 family protein [Bacteroidales bacterium]|nr:DUF3256 family protein [Bacteroidales bacterium]